ncbi:MAG: SLC13 family permease [Planctomycetota bacterium]
MTDQAADLQPIARWKWGVLGVGPLAAALLFALLPHESRSAAGELVGLSRDARCVIAIGSLMALWWITEAVPLEATALLPILLFPVLGIMDVKSTCAPFADPTIFFFMGGMMMGAAMERWGLPRRFALIVLSRVGTSPRMLVLGAMIATAIISMWVNNTSTTVMMLPIGLSIVRLFEQHGKRVEQDSGLRTEAFTQHAAPSTQHTPASGNLAVCMVLGIAYAATIGGIGTLFGTAPNIILQSNISNLMHAELSFFDYAKVGIPIMVLYLPVAWLVLIVMFPVPRSRDQGVHEQVRRELASLGPISGGERAVLIVLTTAVVLWVSTGSINEWIKARTGIERTLSEAGISIAAAVALFIWPVRTLLSKDKDSFTTESTEQEAPRTHSHSIQAQFPHASPSSSVPPVPSVVNGLSVRVPALDWPTASSIHWGVLILFGGGLSLAEAMSRTGVNTAVGSLFAHLKDMPLFLVVLGVTAIITMATEFASNTAIATTFLPIAYAGAIGLGVHPYVLMFPVALACSYAYMMPMGTPPNAMAVATGRVRIRHMVKAGLVLNIIAILLVSTYCYYVCPMIE